MQLFLTLLCSAIPAQNRPRIETDGTIVTVVARDGLAVDAGDGPVSLMPLLNSRGEELSQLKNANRDLSTQVGEQQSQLEASESRLAAAESRLAASESQMQGLVNRIDSLVGRVENNTEYLRGRYDFIPTTAS